MLYTNMRLFCPNWCYTRKYDVLCPKLYYIRNLYTWKYDVSCPNLLHLKSVMSEHMLHTNVRLLLSELMLHTKMYNVRTYFTTEYEMFSVRTYVTYENMICLNLCYKRKYDVWCPNLYYIIRKCVMSEPIMHRKIWYLLSEIMLHLTCVRSEHMLHTNMRLFSVRTNVTYENV